jgi:hypothetical protein
MYKDLSLIDLKIFLKEIIISHEVLDPNEFSESDIPNVKNGKIIFELDVTFNQYLLDGFFDSFDILKDKLFEEIDFNKENEDKQVFDNYLFDIKGVVDFIIGHFTNDKITNELFWGNMKFSEELQEFNLNEFYLNKIKIFKRTLYEKMVNLQSRLIKIPEYKHIKYKNQKHYLGNTKIEWNKQLNQLVDFYLNQLEHGLIDTEKENLKKFLINNFTFKRMSLSESSVATYLDPNKKTDKLPKENKKLKPSDFL